MNKKILSIVLILALVLVSTVLLSGCKTDTKDAEVTESSVKATEKPVETEEPKEEEKQKEPITIWTHLPDKLPATVTSLNDTPFYEIYSSAVGIEFKYLHPPIGTENEQFNLLVASNDLPDIMFINWVAAYKGGPAKAIEENIIIRLNDYIDGGQAPNLSAFLSGDQEADRMVKTDAGDYYVFPFYRTDDAQLVWYGPIIREDWLVDLGMDYPETIEEWYNTLVAFRDEKGATAPLSFETFFLNVPWAPFPFEGAYRTTTSGFFTDNGKITYGPTVPGHKDFLLEMNKWYKEGLIDPDIGAMDNAQVTEKISTGKTGASMGYGSGRLVYWMGAMEDVDPNYLLGGSKYPVLVKGDKPMIGQRSFPFGGDGAAITTSCEQVELAITLLDYLYGGEGDMLANYGVAGVTYIENPDGLPKEWTDFALNNPDGLTIDNVFTLYQGYKTTGGPMISKKTISTQPKYLVEATIRWSETDAKNTLLPPTLISPDSADEYTQIMNSIETYQSEMLLKFIMGTENIEEKWDEYVAAIDGMGLARAIEIQQAAYNNYKAR